MTFGEFRNYESEALKPSPFEKWAAKVEKIVGFDLDGDQDTDGYSLDFAFAEFEQGVTAERYAAKIKNRKRVIA